MRKTCAQAGVSVFTLSSYESMFGYFDKFMLNLYHQLHTAKLALSTGFAHMNSSFLSVVGPLFSTHSTGLITITTFYKKDLLTVHRRIN